MKKILLFVVIILGTALLTTAGFLIIKAYNHVDFDKLKGNIYMQNSNREYIFEGKSNTVLFNPAKKQFACTNFLCNEIFFNSDMTKLLGSAFDKVVEYDVNSGVYKQIYKNDDKEHIFSPRYIPNHNAISFVISTDVMIYDIDAKSIKKMDEIGFEYAWENDGRFFYCNSDEGIIRINFETGASQVIVKGNARDPVLSFDNKLLAYRASKGTGEDYYIYDLVVRDLATGKEWRRKTSSSIKSCAFSPDGNFIAYIREGGEYPYYFKTQRMSVWDYKKNKESTLIKDVGSAANTDFIWR